MPKPISILVTPDQADRLAKFLGNHYMVDLPEDSVRLVHALAHALHGRGRRDVHTIDLTDLKE